MRTLVAALAVATYLMPSAARAESLQLDVHDPSGQGEPTAVSSVALPPGATYLVVVRGTVSIFGTQVWANNAAALCGASEAAPLLPSPGIVNGPVGMDADTLFSVPGTSIPGFPCDSVSIPRHQPSSSGLRINAGAGFRSFTPVGGPFVVPTPDHVYRYEIPSTGEPLSFTFADRPATDNYGIFAINIGSAEAPPPVPVVPEAAPTASAPAGESSVFSELPPTRTCLSRRLFTIHVRAPRAVAFRNAAIAINGEVIRSRRTTKLVTATVDLRRRTKGVYILTGLVVTTRGQVLKTKRRYRTCTPKPAR
jgi:hypothetical protein